MTFSDRDEFQRKPIAENLIRILHSDIDVSPMVIDGQWGTGKTEFCHKLINLLKSANDNVRVAYIDAFKADHANAPLITLVTAIARMIGDEEQRSTFVKKSIPALRYGLKTLGKAGIAWILKKNADDIADEFEEIIKNLAEESINAAIEQIMPIRLTPKTTTYGIGPWIYRSGDTTYRYSVQHPDRHEQTIKDHQNLEETLTTLHSTLEVISEKHQLILFVDELDRCKPDFSIAMLESIKHVFDVPNVQFVLVSNLNQLKDSINHCYGAGVDAQRYLDKFIKYTFRLPDTFTKDRYNYLPASLEHSNNLIDQHSILSETALNKGGAQLIETLIRTNNLSLREVETFVRHLEICHVISNDRFFNEDVVFGHLLLRIFGVYHYCFSHDISEKLIEGHADSLKIAKSIGIEGYISSREIEGSPSIEHVLSVILFYENSEGVEGFSSIDEEEDKFWKLEISHYFRGSTRHRMDGYYSIGYG